MSRMSRKVHLAAGDGRPWGVFLFGLTIVLTACASSVPSQFVEPDWLAVDDFLYQLQRARPERIGETAYDLVVVSVAAAGGSREVIETLKHSPGGEKIILCYMSIGQAEDYRFYWKREWYESPPAWLDTADPNWAGDYWVRYWEPEWQAIIYGSPDSYLDRILDLGFDGVYLDRVDAYEYYEEQGRGTAARRWSILSSGLRNMRGSAIQALVSSLRTLRGWVFSFLTTWRLSLASVWRICTMAIPMTMSPPHRDGRPTGRRFWISGWRRASWC